MQPTTKPTVQERREQLKALSKIAKLMVKEAIAESVNDGLCKMYEQQGHTEIHSFKHWLEKGFCVRRGETALLLWGQPRKGQKAEDVKPDEDDEYKFFPLAYVFSNLQVEKLKK